jgi:hypothetical protein
MHPAYNAVFYKEQSFLKSHTLYFMKIDEHFNCVYHIKVCFYLYEIEGGL